MKLGHAMAILIIVIGIGLTVLHYVLINSTGYTVNIFMAGPALLGWGITMIFFPGADISMEEDTARDGKVNIWEEAPTSHKVAWVIGGSIGFIISLTLFLG